VHAERGVVPVEPHFLDQLHHLLQGEHRNRVRRFEQDEHLWSVASKESALARTFYVFRLQQYAPVVEVLTKTGYVVSFVTLIVAFSIMLFIR
jgi:hypothetical protein